MSNNWSPPSKEELDMLDELTEEAVSLTPWEETFIEDMSHKKMWSDGQKAKLREIHNDKMGG